MDEELLPEIIEKRELNFSYKEKQRKRIEELLGHDNTLLRIYYSTTLANQSQNELYYRLAKLTDSLFYPLKGQELVDEAYCKVWFSKNEEPVQASFDTAKEYAIEIANYLEVFAKALANQAKEIRQKVSEIPQISCNLEEMDKIKRAIEQADDELFIPYVKKLEEIHKRLLEKQQKLS
ncbi:hypothetical protein H6G81_27170 [Scytonema hofmannii FACHB-248]|uniref:Uncharacterized protein n=1 Tax=Scytonema hofmannii FACHB-248 TaxID=1842502 RepID=A0ABR8GX28_9CYAN|nr:MULTISPECIES: hypothetical protein [Nostocales]MBD2608096.1 hypothetical protein [Scytonema hofmannii FACHB-248]